MASSTVFNLPILNGIERLFVCYIVHENEAHSAPIISRCDCAVALLTSRVPDLQLDSLIIPEYSLYFEINANSADKRRCERVVGIAKQE